MRLWIVTLAPLSIALEKAPRAVQALHAFRAVGHEVLLAAPPVGDVARLRAALDVQALLPLWPAPPGAWLPLAANAYRVAHWGARWRPDLYLAVGPRAAMLAHGARGAANGYGMSLLAMPTLTHGRGAEGWLQRRAIQECDRLVSADEAAIAPLVRDWGARRADTFLLPGTNPADFLPLAERLLAEPPGFD